jgi:hypothetical protein
MDAFPVNSVSFWQWLSASSHGGDFSGLISVKISFYVLGGEMRPSFVLI